MVLSDLAALGSGALMRSEEFLRPVFAKPPSRAVNRGVSNGGFPDLGLSFLFSQTS